MRRLMIAALAVSILALVEVSTAQPGDKAWKPVTISYHGQSFFIVTTSQGKRIAFDPHLIPDYGRTEGLKADLILISHNHNDHTRVEALENYRDKDVRIIRGLKNPSLKADWNLVDETI